MRIANWLRKHRKQVLIHTSVIAAFVVFTLLMAEPLFDTLERIPGEAQLHRIRVPAEPGAMRGHIDELEIAEHTAVEVRGWAFIEGQDSEGSEVFIVLESASRIYVFDTRVSRRGDVTRHFSELGLDLDHSGFVATIPARKIADGEYTVGIYIRKGALEAVVYTDKTIAKSGATIEAG